MLASTVALVSSVTVPVVGLTASIPDLLRLVVLPVFGWAAYRDIETRRVPTRTWYPLVALALSLLAWEGYHAYVTDDRLFFLQVAISVGFIIPLVTAFWYMGSFGGADTKAFYVIALLLPTFPTYYFPGIAFPAHQTTVGVFSLTILSNTVVAGALYPLGVAVTNLVRGRFGWPMLIGRPIETGDVPEEYGMLVETPDGFTTRGLDLDALRMYLRWRKCTLTELRADPDRYRDPGSLPTTPGEVGDGNIATDGGSADERSESADSASGEGRVASSEDERSEASEMRMGAKRHASSADERSESAAGVAEAETADDTPGYDDPWGAEAFLDDMETGAYGTSPEDLRGGLDVLAAQDEVWISPGIPFIVPMFFGILLSLTYGDVLVTMLSALGLG